MGREQWFSTPKDEISLLEIRSKIERQGVQSGRAEMLFRFYFIYTTSTISAHLQSLGSPAKSGGAMQKV